MRNLKKKILFHLTLPQRIYTVYQQKGLKLTLYDIVNSLSWNLCWYLYPKSFRAAYNPSQKLEIVHRTSKKTHGKPEIVFFIGSLAAGGAERQIVRLAIGLKAHGYTVSIIVQHKGKDYDHYTPLALAKGIVVSQFSLNDYIWGLKYLYKHKLTKYFSIVHPNTRKETLLLIGKIHAKQNCILHCYLDQPNIIGSFAGILTGMTTRISIRNVNPEFFFPENAPWMRSTYTTLLQHPLIKLESNCKNNYNNYAQWLNMSVPCAIMHNGIELSDVIATVSRQDMRKQLSIPETTAVIIFIGRLSSEKRPLDLVYVAEKVLSTCQNVCFIHAGIGPLEQDLKQLIQEKHLEHNIKLLGRRDDIPNLLHMADMLLLMSQAEGMPNVVMEAMAAALPVVSTRVGAVPELIEDNVHGFMANPGDIEVLADSIIKLIKNPELAKSMGLAGQQRIKEHFSAEKLVQKAIASYKQENEV